MVYTRSPFLETAGSKCKGRFVRLATFIVYIGQIGNAHAIQGMQRTCCGDTLAVVNATRESLFD